MLPKMLKYYITPNTTNMLVNLKNDSSYFKSTNSFFLNSIALGPFDFREDIDVCITDFLGTELRMIKDKKLNVINNLFYCTIVQFH
jgi:hypothetical protein